MTAPTDTPERRKSVPSHCGQELVDLFRSEMTYRGGFLYFEHGTRWHEPGALAGNPDKKDYRMFCLGGHVHLQHRAIFAIHHGYLPTMVDHIDGNTSNNLIENLRPASPHQNSANCKLFSTNTSGVKGVYRHASGKWCAAIRTPGRRHNLGLFEHLEDASEAIRLFRAQLHGEYARHEVRGNV